MERNINEEIVSTYRRKKNIRVKQLRYRVGIGAFLIIIMLMSVVVSGQKISFEAKNQTINTSKVGMKINKKSNDVKNKKSNDVKDKGKESTENQTDKILLTKINRNKPMVALTFDDGPGLRTMELLEVLEQYDARATFFLCGTSLLRTNVEVSEILKTMDRIGCDIGNHTMNHKQLDLLEKKQIKQEISGVDKIIRKHTGHNAEFIRPPYGAGIHNKKVINTVAGPIIYWSVDTLDWKTRNKKSTIKTVMNNVQDGDIILMHDIHGTSVDAAKEIIPKLIKKGYQLVTVSEMAEVRGVNLKNGKTYFNFKK